MLADVLEFNISLMYISMFLVPVYEQETLQRLPVLQLGAASETLDIRRRVHRCTDAPSLLMPAEAGLHKCTSFMCMKFC